VRNLIPLHPDPDRRPSHRDRAAAPARRLKELVLARWGGLAGVTVSVNEVRCYEPGCPDLATVIAIWRPGQAPLRLRIAKPVAAITDADLLFLL
jgi:hypothetical protein